MDREMALTTIQIVATFILICVFMYGCTVQSMGDRRFYTWAEQQRSRCFDDAGRYERHGLRVHCIHLGTGEALWKGEYKRK